MAKNKVLERKSTPANEMINGGQTMSNPSALGGSHRLEGTGGNYSSRPTNQGDDWYEGDGWKGLEPDRTEPRTGKIKPLTFDS